MTITYVTLQDRYKAAWKRIRKAGVVTRINVRSCCRGCALADSERWFGIPEEKEDDTLLAWTYGGQGSAVTWVEGRPYYDDAVAKIAKREGSRRWVSSAQLDAKHSQYNRVKVDRLYIYHSGPGIEAAKIVKEAFEAEMFHVEWDGTEAKAVEVVFGAEEVRS